jgi:FtsP/CotA-like multicopper oxidase with cupredoxin domain
MVSRRDFVTRSALAGSALLVSKVGLDVALADIASAQEHDHEQMGHGASPAPAPSLDSKPAPEVQGSGHGLAPGGKAEASLHAAMGDKFYSVETPNGTILPSHVVKGVRVFHLIAEPLKHEFAPGLVSDCWGYNGSTPGPTIECLRNEHVRIYVTNRLPEPTAVHWHGVLLPNGMDGVGGLTQPYIRQGETYRYEFTPKYSGTFMYHPHVDEMTQMGMGLMGMLIVHDEAKARADKVDRDFALMLSEWKVTVGASRPDPREMSDFNVLTINGKAFPGTAPLVVRTGQRVRIRFGNLSAMHNHPMHLHGYAFRITGTDGGPVPKSAQSPDTTVLVPVGSTRDIEFVADVPGDWAMHCHFTHHVMNQMGHEGHNMLGMNPGDFDKRMRKVVKGYMTMGHTGMAEMAKMKMAVPENSIAMQGLPGKHDYIDMGGMFTVLKVRDGIKSYEDPGWYDGPSESQARVATAEELAADGIKIS